MSGLLLNWRMLWVAASLAPIGAFAIPLQSIEEIRALNSLEISKAPPVQIRGVLTYYDPASKLGFVQDDSGGINIRVGELLGANEESDPSRLQAGDVVELEGIVEEGRFAPRIVNPPGERNIIRKVGESFFPKPVSLNPQLLMDPTLDATWVETIGVVRKAEVFGNRRLIMVLSNGIETYRVVIPGNWKDNPLPPDLVGSRILVEGVYGSIINTQQQLIGLTIYCPSLLQMEVLDPGGKQVFLEDPVAVPDLLSFRSVALNRVVVKGKVTATFPERGVYLRVEGEPLEVLVIDTDLPPPGAEVLAAGYPARTGNRVYLHTARLRMERSGPAPAPRLLPSDDDALRNWHGEYVETTGTLLDTFTSKSEQLLLVLSGNNTLPVRLSLAPEDTPIAIPNQALISLKGILTIQEEPYSTPLEPWTPPKPGAFLGYRIRISRADDISIVSGPPFWSPQRIVVAVSGLGLGIGLLILWTGVLQRRVRRQTDLISAKMRSVHVSEERERIARELHDTVEQEMAGIGIHLELAIAQANEQDSRMVPTVRLALKMLRRTLTETHRSILNLRSRSLEVEAFHQALAAIAEQMQLEKQLEIKTDLHPLSRPLNAVTRHNLMRITQEALQNAALHSCSETVELSLHSESEELHLRIRDHGKGCDPSAAPPGHFGIMGMRERTGKINGCLRFSETPGGGTTIDLYLPLEQPAS